MDIFTPYGRPFYVTAKPVGARCNLRCEYCYYLEKSGLYPRQTTPSTMDDDTLTIFIRDYIRAQPSTDVVFTWHGGEPLIRPLKFYQRVIELQQRFSEGHNIINCLQTNGTLLTDEWGGFLAENHWLTGVSIDGPQHLHDRYRLTRDGGPSFDKVMHGIEILNRHGAEWNALAVVNAVNAGHPLEFYDFFRQIGCRYIQFTPVVERMRRDGRLASIADDGSFAVTEFSVSPGQWGEFLCRLFDEWVRNDVGEYYVQLFDAALANWAGVEPPVCTMAPVCGNAIAMEYNGDVYCCDHFVFPEYLLGNIRTKTFSDMMFSTKQRRFGADKRRMLPDKCKQCRYLFACNGECPRNRFAATESGQPYLNYLCEGYYRFFEYVAPYMDFMKRELDNQRPPANIMEVLRAGGDLPRR